MVVVRIDRPNMYFIRRFVLVIRLSRVILCCCLLSIDGVHDHQRRAFVLFRSEQRNGGDENQRQMELAFSYCIGFFLHGMGAC